MSADKLASIIINNYNYGRFLRDAIDSALGQTYPNTELIVVDDGSTDTSREIIAEYEDRITPVLKENGGMGSTYNAGFPLTKGDLIFILDSDDMLFPGAVERVVSLFQDPDVSKAHWPLAVVDEYGKATGELEPNSHLAEGDLHKEAVLYGPDCYDSPPTSGNAWSRKFLEQVLPVPELEFRQHADTYLVTLAPIYGTIKAVAEPQGCYRVHGGNDYACKSDEEKNRRNREIYEHRCMILKEHLSEMGIKADPQKWKDNHWLYRVPTATQEIANLIPPGDKFILVDEENWGSGEYVQGRRRIPFLERDGQYWGPPPDDETAITELERLKRQGAKFIAFAWPAFWWLEHYGEFHRYLKSQFPCALENQRLVVFDLRK